MFITGGGDPAKITQGKQLLLWTVIGLTVILLAKGLVAVLTSVLEIKNRHVDIHQLRAGILRQMRRIPMVGGGNFHDYLKMAMSIMTDADGDDGLDVFTFAVLVPRKLTSLA